MNNCKYVSNEQMAILSMLAHEEKGVFKYFPTHYFNDGQYLEKVGFSLENNLLVFKKIITEHPNKLDIVAYPLPELDNLVQSYVAGISKILEDYPRITILSSDDGKDPIISFINVKNGNQNVVARTTVDEYGRLQVLSSLDKIQEDSGLSNSIRNTLDMAYYLESLNENEDEYRNIGKLIQMLDNMNDKLEIKSKHRKK